MSVVRLAQIIEKTDAEFMLEEIREGASITKAAMFLSKGRAWNDFAKLRKEIGDRQIVEAIMTLATYQAEPIPADGFEDGDIVQHKTTGELLEVVGTMWWSGSWEARSKTETYEFCGSRLPVIRRVHPTSYNLVERKVSAK